MNWVFALINNRLAEFYFNKEKGKLVAYGHCYVEKSEYKTIKEQQYIKEDTQKHKFSYRNKIYRDKNKNIKIPIVPIGEVRAEILQKV